ncbi:MAG: hypothetical protein HZR80_14135 [Candidatus Heimdallarchaeota archaeon]
MAKEALDTKSFRSYSEPNLIDIGISSKSDLPDYLIWCRNKDIDPNSFSEQFINVDERLRLRFKIEKKLERNLQLPVDEPGILVIYSNHIFGILHSFRTYMTALQQMIANYDNIIALVTDYTMFKESRIIEYEDNFFFLDNRHEFGGWIYLIWNKYSKFKMTKELKDRLIQTFKAEL